MVLFTVLTFLAGEVAAQEEFEFVDLGVEFTNAPATVKINGVFGLTARIFLDANSSNIPSSEIISVSVFLRDPNGIILDSHQQSWDGFSQGEMVQLLSKETADAISNSLVSIKKLEQRC